MLIKYKNYCMEVQIIYGLVSNREIPHLKKGKRLYFLRSDIDTRLSPGRRKTVKEISEEVNISWRNVL